MSDLFQNPSVLSFRCTEIAASLDENEEERNRLKDTERTSVVQNISDQSSNDLTFRCSEIASSLNEKEGSQNWPEVNGESCRRDVVILINDDGWAQRFQTGDAGTSIVRAMQSVIPDTQSSVSRQSLQTSAEIPCFEDVHPDVYRVDANTVLDPMSLLTSPPVRPNISDLSQQGTVVAASRSSGKRKATCSAVWNHFTKDLMKAQSQCSYCKLWLKSLNASNVKRHLKACKPTIWETVEQKDSISLKEITEPEQKQMKLDFQKTYASNHPKQIVLRKKLSILYGCTTISGNVMQTKEFKECFQALDPRIKIPATITIRRDFQVALKSAREKVKLMIKSVKRITISSDIWTKKGNRSSFLGVTATFFYPPLKKKINVILGVQKFSTSTHKASDIIREMRKVMAVFEISPKQVWRSITDGASNMICSHRIDKQIFCQSDTVQEDQRCSDSENNSDDSCNDEESSIFETNPILATQDRSETTDIMNPGDVQLNDIVEESCGMNPAYRRLTCFIHTTLICLKTFELDVELSAVIDRVKALVSKFSRSAKLMTDLVKEAGVGLVSFCEIRWNYVYLVLVRLIRVEVHVKLVLERHGKQKYALSNADFEKIRQITEFLKPFHDYTCMISKEKEAVSSEVIVAILSMHYHLQKYRLMMPPSQRSLARKYLLNEYSLMISEENDSNFEEHENNREREVPSFQPNSRFPLIQEMKQALLAVESRSSNKSVLDLEAELNKYLSNEVYDKSSEDADVFEFWLTRMIEYPLLAPIALDYLSVPDSTAHTERTFGTATAFTRGLSNRLDGINLENRVFLIKNRRLLQELDNVFSD
ncbi:unnamed protein product [Allacma fusca]|uniref:BED-type domain-containing protein n=1 Tax=Allacma fusca TaxID=39272 RepID=A0A8J2PKD8_9HEXA|nr:unnamed protein product [Allacma fusca]